MKKALLIALLVIIPAMAFAQPTSKLTAPIVFETTDNLFAFIQNLLNWFFVIIIVLAIFYLLYVALRYVISGGVAASVKAAGTAFGYILLGLVVAVIAKGLVFAVCNLIGGGSCRIF